VVQEGVGEDGSFNIRREEVVNNFYQIAPGYAITGPEREWLRSTVLGIAIQFPRPVVVNIGVAQGATMHCLRSGAPIAQLFGVDIDYKSISVQREEELEATMIEGDSNMCHVDFHLGIHFLFMDGDHHYPVIKADIEGWAHKVVLGGVLGFHDYSPCIRDLQSMPYLAGVKKAVDEWMVLESVCWRRLQTPDSICAFKRVS